MNALLTVLLWGTYLVGLYSLIFWLITLLNTDITKEPKLKKIKNWPSVSVLIPAYNEEKTIEACALSALSLDYPKDKLSVIIINDGSKDKTKQIAERLAKKYDNLRVINLENGGKARAINKALKTVDSEYFACLDADSFVDRETLKKMISIFKRSSSKVAAVVPAMKVYNPKTALQKIQDIEYNTAILLNRLLSELDSAYVTPGPFSVYKTKVVKKIGGFDEQSLTEDQEIAYRLQKNFYTIKQCPDAWVFTSTPSSGRAFFKQRRRWNRGGIETWLKYRRLLLNPKYGNFGIMQMPLIAVGYLMGVLALVFAFFFYIKPLFRSIHDLYLVNWDFMTYIKDALKNGLFHNFTWLNFDFLTFFFVFTFSALAIITVIYAFKYTKEGWKLGRILMLIPYILLYYLLQSVIVTVALTETILNKKRRW